MTCVQCPCHIQRTLFWSSPPQPLILRIFPSFLRWCFPVFVEKDTSYSFSLSFGVVAVSWDKFLKPKLTSLSALLKWIRAKSLVMKNLVYCFIKFKSDRHPHVSKMYTSLASHDFTYPSCWCLDNVLQKVLCNTQEESCFYKINHDFTASCSVLGSIEELCTDSGIEDSMGHHWSKRAHSFCLWYKLSVTTFHDHKRKNTV